MRHPNLRPVLAIGLAATLIFGAAACSKSDSEGAATSSDKTTTTLAPGTSTVQLDKLAGKTIGVQTGTTGETYAKAHKPKGATIKSFADTDGLFGALESGDIQAILQDLPVNAGRATKDKSVSVVETYKTDEQYGMAVAKDNTKLQKELNTALADVKKDGTYDKLYAKYFPKDGADPGPGPEASTVAGTKTLKVCSDIPYAPMEFEGEGPRGLQYTGFDIELIDAMAATMDAKLDVIDSDFDGILGNLSSGGCDIVVSSLTITPERQKQVLFTEPYFDADQSLLIKAN